MGGAPGSRTVLAASDGLLNAVVYWFRLEAAPAATHESWMAADVSSAPPKRRERAGSWRAGWRQAAVYLQSPMYVRRGDVLTVRRARRTNRPATAH